MKPVVRLLLLLIAIVLGGIGLVSAAGGATPPSAGVAAVWRCEDHHHSATATRTTPERGPPETYHRGTTYDPVDHWSHGASARRDVVLPQPNHGYDHPARLVHAAGVASTTAEAAEHAWPDPTPAHVARSSVAANGAPAAERLFTSRAVGVDSKLLGNSYARGESGLLNRTGSRLKFGWTSSGEFGGGWHLRLGIGRSPLNPNQARFHWDFGSTHVPNSVANDLLDVLRGLNGL